MAATRLETVSKEANYHRQTRGEGEAGVRRRIHACDDIDVKHVYRAHNTRDDIAVKHV